ncbi:MAG TPA: LpqB family beta-propeller domain-containing protein, partial [Arthrobacter sp.]|nr:LpqB family beta-propeller domain-containing protein [Arthrobacter sp.]
PSFDRYDWVWTSGPGASGATEVLAYRPSGIAEGANVPGVTLAPAWLSGASVKEFRIARDGTRALVISTANGKTRVQLTGIVRNGDGTPKDLTAPITLLTAHDPDQGVWVNDMTVAVMKGAGGENVTPELLSMTATAPQQLAPWSGLTGLSAGNGPAEIYGQSADGIFQRLGNGWSLQLKGAIDPAFPG